MSQPNTVVPRPRDPRIDAFRGLALIMIFIDHVPGNPFEYFTIRNIGFSDAAEAFFVMSGVAAGLAYSGRFLPQNIARNGIWYGVAPIWHRAWVLYLVQIFLTVWAIAIYSGGALFFDIPALITQINLRQVYENTQAALIGIPALTHQLGYVNILPAYMVLLAVTPFAIMLGLRQPWLLAAASVLMWFSAGLWRLNLPNFPNPGGWFFNPLAWQLVFTCGLLIGLSLGRKERFVPRSRLLFGLCLGFLLLVFAWRHVPGVGSFLNHQMARLGAAGVPFHLVSHDKTFLALPRLLHCLALVYVLSCSAWVFRATASGGGAPLRLLGRNGLLVFASGTLLALVFNVILAGAGGAMPYPVVLPPMGIFMMLAVAWIFEAVSSKKPRTAYAAAP
ncbi:OpgC domain-containing protein [Pseudorhodobacter turbinis]|uniref:OpgC domain-containing protein n=1 Tax=Pseudorhodobacter turbinis TaxID=2500533 RepID=A0A4P8EED8_9RHOB|nr:OpgC domain-containing protein [Pseudorhodobacter turbinis]QCO54993.1 OpgC domain-containing protein [Pseudorhodobacter turbinis]